MTRSVQKLFTYADIFIRKKGKCLSLEKNIYDFKWPIRTKNLKPELDSIQNTKYKK